MSRKIAFSTVMGQSIGKSVCDCVGQFARQHSPSISPSFFKVHIFVFGSRTSAVVVDSRSISSSFFNM